MNEITLTPKAVVRHILDGAGLSIASASRNMGRERTFLASYTTKGHIPTLSALNEIADTCGYEIHIIGHGEDILVSLEDA